MNKTDTPRVTLKHVKPPCLEIRFDKNANNLPADIDADSVYQTTQVVITEIVVEAYVIELQDWVKASLLDDEFQRKTEEALAYFDKVEDEDIENDDYFYYGVFMRQYS